MGLTIPTRLSLQLIDIGATPRHMQDNAFFNLKSLFFEKGNNSNHIIKVDENGEYTFTKDNMTFDHPHDRIFYDGNTKILEYFYDETGLVLNLFTDKQTNIFINLQLEKCTITAVGPLCIDGEVEIKSDLKIVAEALYCLDTIRCMGDIHLITQQGTGLLATISAHNLTVNAAYLHQSADILLSGQYDIAVQAFQKTAGCKLHASILRLISEQCEFLGETIIDKASFLAANNLFIGKKSQVTSLHIPENHHVHVVNCISLGQSIICIGNSSNSDIQAAKQRSTWIIDQLIYIDSFSSIDYHNTSLDIGEIESSGAFSVKNCTVKTTLTTVKDGYFLCKKTHWNGKKINAFAGSLVIDEQSKVYLSKSLITDKTVQISIKKSDVLVKNKILLFGEIHLRKCNILSDNFRAYQNIIIERSNIRSSNFCEIQGYSTLKKTSIHAKTVLLTGTLAIDDLDINAHTVDYQSNQANIVNHFVRSNRINIDGSDIEDAFAFEKSRLVARNFAIKNLVVVKNSSFVGIDDAFVCHTITGRLIFDRSQFITESQLQPLIGSHIELRNYSEFLSGIIYSHGEIQSQNSTIHCDELVQNSAPLTMTDSELHVNHNAVSYKADLLFDEGSKFFSSNLIAGYRSTLRLNNTSVLVLRNQGILGANSIITSNASTMCGRKFVVLGSVELCASFLSAEELSVYDQFTANEKTIIHIEKELTFSKTAKAYVESSITHADDIQTFGELDLIDSTLVSNKTTSCWSDSNTRLEGASSIVAEDMLLRGTLVTKKTANNTESHEPAVPKPTIQIKKRMDIASIGKILGDDDLVIDADQIAQSGIIELSADFRAKGTHFYHTGSITANSIYLGFDDAVINHGSFSSKNMTVHSNFMNVLGRVYAQESFACSGFISVNLGLMSANNHVNNSFFSLNAGLVVPNFSADSKYIFSTANAMAVAKTAALMFAPTHAIGIQLITMIPGLFYNAHDLYHLSSLLDWNTVKNMRRHELMPLLCKVKNIFNFGQGLYNTCNSFDTEMPIWSASFTKFTEHPSKWVNKWSSTIKSADWKDMGFRTAGLFGGSYTDNSIVHVNVGGSFVGNTAKSSFVYMNTGAEHSLFSHSVMTQTLYNTGSLVGDKATFSAQSIKNDGTLKGKNQFTVHANKVDNSKTGILEGKKANIKINELHQQGHLDIDGGRLSVKVLTDSHESHTKLANVALHGKRLDLTGSGKLKNVLIKEDESVRTSAEANLATDNVTIETKTFTHAGQLNYEHGLTIKAETATFTKGSVVGGQKTSEDELFVPKQAEESTQTSNDIPDEPEKEFKPQHVLSILANRTTLNGQVSGGDYTQIQGQKIDESSSDETTATVMNNELIVGESADIDLKYGSIAAKKMDNLGHVDLENFNISLDELHQGGNFNVEKGQLNINVATDERDSHTILTDVALHGATLDLIGESKLTNVLIQETEHVYTTADATVVTDNVTIETETFTHAGKWDYEHGLTIKAETATFTKGSVVGGQKTSEDELFVPKQTQASVETNTETGKEPEKEFKPQHILNIVADKAVLSGKLSGGDYTIIKGNGEGIINEDGTENTALCEQFIIDDSADIDLKYGSISAKKGDASGTVVLDSFNVTIKEGVFNQSSTVTLKNSNYKGDSLLENGLLTLDHSSANITNTQLTQQGRELLIDSTLSSQYLVDDSQMSYKGQSGIVTDSYTHTGHVKKIAPPAEPEKKNLFYVQAKTANLNGSTDLDNGYYDIEHLADGTQFVAGTGKYSLYLSSESLTFKTQDSFRLNDSIQRNCDVSVEATDIIYGGAHNQNHDLTFISTVGDVALTNTIQARNLFVKSAKNIYTNNSNSTESVLSFEAKGGYYNYGGTLNGNDVAVKASEIKNYTRGSNGAASGTVLPMGGAGIINARNNLFLQATEGNIENHGGILRAGNYAQLLSSGDVLNLCNIQTYQGRYDLLQEFNGGLISGGQGKDTDGVGLYIKAEGQVISDASDFVSNGSNYIDGVHGVQFTARSHTAITKYETSKTWYGKKKTVIETSTVTKGCNIQSSSGRNIIQSGEGSVSSIASRFISPGGTDISAKGDVKLFSLKTQDRHIESTSKFWGLSKKEIDSIHQNATPTLFYDNGTTRIHSSEGNVDARGAYFVGAGDLSIKAKNKILFGVDILNHEVNEESNAWSVSAPGMGAWNTYKKGGNAWDIVTSEDATLAKINSLYGSNNAEEVLANSSNLGIDLCNTTNSIMRGFGENGLSSELMARYGLGGATGFSPSLTLSLTQSKTKSTFQTQSQGGVDRGGNVILEAGEGVILENGVRVHAGGNLEVDAPVLIAQAAELKSSTTQTVISESIGIAPLSGQAQSIGASYSKTQSQSTTYKNAELSAGGNMYLHNQDKAMNQVELDGANISAKTLDMNTDILMIRDKQDTSQAKSESFSVNSSGQFSVYKGKGHDKVTNQNSGIYVTDGINTDGHKVHAGETYMEGGKILTDGVNCFETDKLVSQSLQDEKTFNGIGISGNINDLNRLTGQACANIAGEQVIATGALTFDHVDYKAIQQSVLYGSQGTDLDIKETLGDAIHTTSSNGKIIQQNDAMHLHVDIPLTNKDYLKTCAENMKAGGAKLADLLIPKQENKDPVDFAKAELLITEDRRKKRKSSKENDNNAANDSDIYSESMQEMVDDAMQHLHFDSPDKERKFKHDVEVARQEEKSTGRISSQTRKKLSQGMTDALMDTLKTGSESTWDKLTGKMGSEYSNSLRKLLSNPKTFSQASIKTYMGSKSLLFTFVINLASASMDSDVLKTDLLKKGMSKTASDVAFGLILSVVAGEAAASIGWLLIPFKLMDNYYDQTQVDRLVEQGISNLSEAQSLYRLGHPIDAWNLERAAADQMGSAARTQAGHDLARIIKSIESHIESACDSAFHINSQTNNQTFFKPNQDKMASEKQIASEFKP